MAVASLEMFKAGYFSGDPTEPYQVNAAGLHRLSPGQLAIGLQVSDKNPLAGLEGRVTLLSKLAEALEQPEYFGSTSRPGNLLGKLTVQTLYSMTDLARLPPLTSHYTSINAAHCYHTHFVGRSYQRPR